MTDKELAERIVARIDDDAYAGTFQTLGAYRTALLSEISACRRAMEPHPPHRQCGCEDCAPSFEPTPPADIRLPGLPAPLKGICYMVSAVGSTHGTPAGQYYNEHHMQAYAREAVELNSQSVDALLDQVREALKSILTDYGHEYHDMDARLVQIITKIKQFQK